tara:strand:+ start:2400 stop:2621 length:222 start_codon:yes stop_codon:yes gene_type:complete
MIKLLIISLLFVSCSALRTPIAPVKPKKELTYAQRRPELMQRCMERFLAHGVPFNDIVKACDERIYKNNNTKE